MCRTVATLSAKHRSCELTKRTFLQNFYVKDTYIYVMLCYAVFEHFGLLPPHRPYQYLCLPLVSPNNTRISVKRHKEYQQCPLGGATLDFRYSELHRQPITKQVSPIYRDFVSTKNFVEKETVVFN